MISFQVHATELLSWAVIILYRITFHQVSFPQNDGFINTAHYVDPTVLSCSRTKPVYQSHHMDKLSQNMHALAWLLEYLQIHI